MHLSGLHVFEQQLHGIQGHILQAAAELDVIFLDKMCMRTQYVGTNFVKRSIRQKYSSARRCR